MLLLLPAALALAASWASALDNGLGLAPPMGFNSWYAVGCSRELGEEWVLSVASKLREAGLAKYEYLIIDDCWAVGRDNHTQVLIADPAGFPQGIKHLANEVRKAGFKLGIYTDRGTKTCEERPGSLGHESLDARTFASWGIDYLKEDSCFADQSREAALAEYAKMRDALNSTGRPVFFALCGWRRYFAVTGQTLANSWRVSLDNINWEAVKLASSALAAMTSYAGQGGWNDGDLLLGSDLRAQARLTPLQSRTQFSLWCVAQSPLIISGMGALDVGSFDWQTYSNKVAIRVNQALGYPPGTVVASTCAPPPLLPPTNCVQVWARQISSNEYALVFVNFAKAVQPVECSVQKALGRRFVSAGVTVSSVYNLDPTVKILGGVLLRAENVPGDGGSAFVIVRVDDSIDSALPAKFRR